MDRPDELGSMPTGDFSRLQEFAERLEEAWKSQGDTTIGVDLARFMPPDGDSLRLPVLYELIKTDLSIRMGRGQLVGLEYYLEKFPELGPSASLSPHLILEEYLIRKRQGIPAPLSDYKRRYPEQYPRFEQLIPKEYLTPPPPPPSAELPAFAAPAAQLGDEVPFFFGLGQGKTLGGRFVLIKRIGGGQFGEVWKALDTHGEIEKALKIILRPMDTEEAKMELEALQNIKRLNHPYLLRTESFWQAGDRLVIVMELAEGSLRDVLKKCRKGGLPGIPVPDLLRYFHNAASALDYLHNKDILHRDIKPDNILIVEEYAKVGDLGLAKLMSQGRSMTASLAGTMAYMAPEVWRERISPRSDQYSLAVAYAELRQGKTPFHGRNLADFFHAHKETMPELGGISHDEQEVLSKALAKNPHERFLSCVEFMRALDEAVARQVPDEPQSVRKVAASTAQVAALATGTAADLEARLMTLAPSRPGTEAPVEEEAPLTEKPHDTAPPKLKPPSEPALEAVVKHPPSWQATTDKPAGWRTAVQGAAPTTSRQPATTPEPATPRQPSRWPGRVLAAALLVGAVAGLGWFGHSHKLALKQEVEGHVADGDFEKAFAATDGILAWPFRSGLRDGVRGAAVEFAKAALAKDPTKAAAVCEAAAVYYSNDADIREQWGAALERIVLDPGGLVATEQFSEAIRHIDKLPDESTMKTRLRATVETAWAQTANELLNEGQWNPALKTAEEMLEAFRESNDAKSIHGWASAALDVHRLTTEAKHDDARAALPTDLPQLARQKLDDHIKKSWTDHARRQSGSEELTVVRDGIKSWTRFNVHYPNEANELEVAQRQLCKLAVRDAGREAEAQGFDAALELLKEAATASRHPDDQTAVKKQRQAVAGGQRDHLLNLAKNELDAERSQPARVHLAILENKLNDPDYGLADKALTDLQTLQARALAQSGNAREVDKVVSLFQKVNRGDNAWLERLCEDMAKACERDKEFSAKAADVLLTARDNVSNSLSRRIVNLVPTVAIVESAWTHLAKDPVKSLTDVRRVKNHRIDTAAAGKYFAVWEGLAAAYAAKGDLPLERADLTRIEEATKESATLAEMFPRALAKYIEKTVADWPKDAKEWEARLADCRKVAGTKAANTWVNASMAECLVALKRVDGSPALSDADGFPFADYARALLLSHDNHREKAAEIIAKLSPKDDWLIEPRRRRAAEILLDAALPLRPSGKLFESAENAGGAFDRFKTALAFSNDSTKDWPARARLDFALAAHFKPDADMVQAVRRLADLPAIDELDAADRDLLGMLRISKYADAVAYLKDALQTKKANELLKDRLDPAIELGRAQLKSPPLRQIQAARLAAKGWLLRRGNAPADEIRKALDVYDQSITHDGETVDYWLERASCRIELREDLKKAVNEMATAIELQPKDARPYSLRALARLVQSRSTVQIAQRVDLLKAATADVDEAFSVNPNKDELPKLLYRASVIALELGNYEWQLVDQGLHQGETWKEHLRQAAKHAERILAEFPDEESELVQVALGNACEDLAHFAKEDIASRFAQAEKAFSRALKLSKNSADRASRALSRGRCRYRWLESGTAPAETLNEAITDIELAIRDQASDEVSAEAHYWKGLLAASSDPERARVAHTTAINLGDKAPHWAMSALTALFDMDFDEHSKLKSNNPDVAIRKVQELERHLNRIEMDSARKRVLWVRLALALGEAYEAKKDFKKAVEAYGGGLVSDLTSFEPSSYDVRLRCKWVFARAEAGLKDNLVSDADRAVDWSNRMRRGRLTEPKLMAVKADALWNAAVARLTVDATQYRHEVVEKLQQCVEVGKDHSELWYYRAMLGIQLFELSKNAKEPEAVERYRQESLTHLEASRSSAPAGNRAEIDAMIAQVRNAKSK